MSVVVLDVGSSSIRSSIVTNDAKVKAVASVPLTINHEGLSQIEYDANALAKSAMFVLEEAIASHPTQLEGLAITTQRATSVLWSRSHIKALAPAISWQDLRTTATCLSLGTKGVAIAPNESGTKYAYLLNHQLLKEDPADVALGTLDSWLAFYLGVGHITDITNVAMSGLTTKDITGYDPLRLEALQIERHYLPAITASYGELGVAKRLSAELPLLSLVGDQQASLFGQHCHSSTCAKVTLGTGVMIDVNLGTEPPNFERRGRNGSYRVPSLGSKKAILWGVEGALLSGGSSLQWFCNTFLDGAPPAEVDRYAAQADTSDGCIFVPALSGLATPDWDFGARGVFLGVSRNRGRNELSDALLRGIAHSVADIVEAIEDDTSKTIEILRVDGKMAGSTVLLQHIADYAGVKVQLSTEIEATSLGAGMLAHLALEGIDAHSAYDDECSYRYKVAYDPKICKGSKRHDDIRQRWQQAKALSRSQIPALSQVKFQ